MADYKLSELAVVPLALPITVGPATIGVLLVMVADNDTLGEFFLEATAMTCSIIAIGIMLYFSNLIERSVGKQGLAIISKITGIILAALAAQIMFTGIKNFMAA